MTVVFNTVFYNVQTLEQVYKLKLFSKNILSIILMLKSILSKNETLYVFRKVNFPSNINVFEYNGELK